MIKKYSFVLILFLCSFFCTAQEIVSYSSLNNTACSGIIANNANVTAVGICRGSGITRKAAATFNSQNWTSNTSIDANDYLEWSITPNFGYQIDFTSLDIRYDRSNNGPKSIDIQVDTGSGFSSIFIDNNVNANGENNTIDLSAYTAILSSVTFRLYGYDATNGTGTFDIEEHTTTNKGIILNGTASPNCSATTTWDGSSWSNGAPNINRSVVIAGNYNTASSGSFSACSLTVNASYSLVIGNSNFVEVDKNVTVNGHLQVETQGAFIQNNDLGAFSLGASGSSQVNKFTEPLTNWYDYTYWGSPVANITVGSALSTSSRRFYYDAANYLDANGDGFDDDANDWQVATGANIMTPGVGYIASHTPIGFFSGARYQYNFIGNLNTGVITAPIAYNVTNARHWNLMGNPYPSALDIDTFFSQNYDSGNGVIDGIVYLWSHSLPASASNSGNDVLNFSISDYAIINLTGEVAGADGKTPGRYIPSGQGFFTPSLASGNLVFKNVMRVTGENSNDLFFRQSNTKKNNVVSNEEKERLWIDLTSNNGVSNQILMAYINNATNAYDGMAYDAEPVYTGYANLYTSVKDDPNYQFAIQAKALKSLKKNERFYVGFNNWINTPTVFTIKIPKVEGYFLRSHNVILNDHLLNTTHNLSISEYSFASEYGEFPNRFEIIFKEASTLSVKSNSLNDSLKIIELENGNVQFKLTGNLKLKHIDILDMLGRNIYSINIKENQDTFNLENIVPGAYFAKVTLSNDAIITKKSIKQK